MHEVLAIGLVPDQLRQCAIQQSDLFQALGNDANRSVVWIVPVIAFAGFFDGGELCLEHDFVNGALFGRKASVDRYGSCNVGGVVVVFTTSIDQQQVLVAELCIVVDVMQRAGIGPGADNRRVIRACIPLRFRTRTCPALRRLSRAGGR